MDYQEAWQQFLTDPRLPLLIDNIPISQFHSYFNNYAGHRLTDFFNEVLLRKMPKEEKARALANLIHTHPKELCIFASGIVLKNNTVIEEGEAWSQIITANKKLTVEEKLDIRQIKVDSISYQSQMFLGNIRVDFNFSNAKLKYSYSSLSINHFGLQTFFNEVISKLDNLVTMKKGKRTLQTVPITPLPHENDLTRLNLLFCLAEKNYPNWDNEDREKVKKNINLLSELQDPFVKSYLIGELTTLLTVKMNELAEAQLLPNLSDTPPPPS